MSGRRTCKKRAILSLWCLGWADGAAKDASCANGDENPSVKADIFRLDCSVTSIRVKQTAHRITSEFMLSA
jgi:hypothetical protein